MAAVCQSATAAPARLRPPVLRPVLAQIEAFKKSLSKFGLIELVRTGRISLKRGERVFDTGAWVPRCDLGQRLWLDQASNPKVPKVVTSGSCFESYGPPAR